MICSKCGAVISDSSKFCTKCGAAVSQINEDSGAPVGESIQATEGLEMNVSPDEKPNKKSKKKLLIIIPAVIVALALIAVGAYFVLGMKKTAVNLNDYLNVEYEGYDGIGTVKATFDSDRFVKDYKERIKPDKNIEDIVREDKELKHILSDGDYDLEKERDVCEFFVAAYTSKGAFKESKKTDLNKLSNGDVLEYEWNIETKNMDTDELIELAAKAFKIELTAEDMEYTVEGLKEVEKFDPFEEVVIEFSGRAPQAYGSLKSYPTDNGLYYSISDNEGLSNGDEITLTANYGSMTEEEYIEKYKKCPDSLEKKVMVEGVDELVTNAGDISDSDMDTLKKLAENRIQEFSKNFSREVSLNSVAFENAFFLGNKNESSWNATNMICMTYKLKVDFKFDNSDYNDSAEFFYPVVYEDVIRKGTGELFVEDYNIGSTYDHVTFKEYYGPKSYNYENFYFYGYESIDELTDKMVYGYKEDYSIDQIASGDGSAADVSAQTPVAEEEPAKEESKEYILPDSSSKKLSMSDLDGLTEDECRIARNEIYARHGRKFDDEELQSYFDSKDWYNGTIEAKDFKENELSDIEMANRDLIVQYEKEQGYR